MKKILVLGAGLVSRPLVRYLLDVPEFGVIVATRTTSKARELVQGHPRSEVFPLNVDDDKALERLVAGCDLAISLLPYTYHVKVAGCCLAHAKPLVTTSYVSDAMRALDEKARARGVILLNEIGLDPGIDHMSAMAVIDRVSQNRGRVTGFMSYCGGLPAPEANDNPLGYKFSWSPKGVLMAGRNPARFLKDGKEVSVPGSELFEHRWPIDVEGAGGFEAYPNRNSLPYIELYGLRGVDTMLRGTLRNPGWCETLKAFADLGLLDDALLDLKDLTPAAWLRKHVAGQGALRSDVAARLGITPEHPILERMAWLGLLGDEPLGIEKGTDIDVLAALMLRRMQYRPGERDMIVLHHEFQAAYENGCQERITSTLVDYGQPGGDSAMARTVSLPAAIAARLVLEHKVTLTGVQIPVVPELYRPVLEELGRLGVGFREKTFPVKS